ncbi:hypothetical protein ACI65C_009492 [Semiaphis heraclei]
MADYSALVVLFVSLSIFVFFKYCLGSPHGDGLDAFRYDNATRPVLQHVVYDEFAGSASAQLQYLTRLNSILSQISEHSTSHRSQEISIIINN